MQECKKKKYKNKAYGILVKLKIKSILAWKMMVSMLTHAVNSKTCADGSLKNSLFPLKDCSWNHLSAWMHGC